MPFVVPWMVLAGAVTGMGWYEMAFTPPLWSAEFVRQLGVNVAMWICCYGVAWAVFSFVRSRRMDLKYNPRTPATDFIGVEILRSFGGVLVLTGYQVLLTAGGFLGANAAPSAVEALMWSGAAALWNP